MKQKRYLETLVYRSVYAIIHLFSLLPINVLYAIASLAFFFAYYIFGYRKDIVIQNLSRSFPDKRYGEIQAIGKKFYTCFTGYFAEIIKATSAPVEKLEENLVFENLELINQNINAGRNVIVGVGHCGNWEMLNFMPNKIPHDIYAVYKPLHSAIMNRLMNKIRSRFGIKVISDKSVVRHILSGQSSNALYLFLADQCPITKDERYKFELLNQETYVFSGMEKLAKRSHAAVVYLYITQLSKGRYKISCVPICTEANLTYNGEITQKYIKLLTENITEEPYGWLWTHKRWKR